MKLKFKINKKTLQSQGLPIILSVSLLILALVVYQIIFSGKFYPGVFVGDTNLTFMTKPQATEFLKAKFNQRTGNNLEFSFQPKTFTVNLDSSQVVINYILSTEEAFALGRNGNLLNQANQQIKTLLAGTIITPSVKMDLRQQAKEIAKIVDQPPKNATLQIDEKGQVTTTPSQVGQSLDQDQLAEAVKNYLIFGKYTPLLPIKTVQPKLTEAAVIRAKQALEDAKPEPLKLQFNDQGYDLDQLTLFSLLNLDDSESLIDSAKLSKYLDGIAQKVDQPVQEALFNFNGARVTAFKPAKEGRKLDIDKTAALINLALAGKRAKTVTLPVTITQPQTQIADVNSLGIKELVGQGVSNFAGSIDNRIYNVNLTASKINGILIPPGQIFSFNQGVGDISAATGFKQAYVIKEGRTVLDDGGGVCQVSTTLFRAALNAGLPIVKRTAHAYRVGYYEQGFPPGLDATVFYPSVDFQFKNDMPNYILVQAHTQGLTIYIDLYGTSDGRVTTLSKSIIASQTPPPTELRQDDPTLPKGVVKQVDWAAWGANVSFTRKVVKNGEIIANETWRSNYRPWQAVYLVGTQ